jgi:hypothetical protein
VRRLAENPRSRDGLVLGIGISVLANSRPFEGAVLTLLCLLPLLRALRVGSSPARIQLVRTLIPAGVVLTLTFLWMGYYNSRVTGNVLRLPYVECELQYGATPLFLFQPLRPLPPTLRYGSMWAVTHHSIRIYHDQTSSWKSFILFGIDKLWLLVRSAFQLFRLPDEPLGGPAIRLLVAPWLRFVLLAPLLLLPLAIRRDPWLRWAALTLVAFGICVVPETYMNPQYGAPVGGLVAILLIQSLRLVRTLRRGRWRYGRALLQLLVALFVLSGVLVALSLPSLRPSVYHPDRRPIISYLQASGGRHLVLVDYGNPYTGGGEWVYNVADIDNQDIIWARFLTPEENRKLLAYYAGRTVWRLRITGKKVELTTYAAARSTEGRTAPAPAASAKENEVSPTTP